MKGLLAGVVFNYWFSWFVNIGLVSKYIGYKWYKQVLDILPVTIVSLLAALVSLGVGYLLHLDMYLDGIVKLTVYVILYLGWSLVFKPEAYTYFLTIIPSKLKIWKKKN